MVKRKNNAKCLLSNTVPSAEARRFDCNTEGYGVSRSLVISLGYAAKAALQETKILKNSYDAAAAAKSTVAPFQVRAECAFATILCSVGLIPIVMLE